MNYQALLQRVLATADHEAYLTPHEHVDSRQRRAMAEIGAAIQAPDMDLASVHALIRRHYEQGRIDKVLKLSALHVLAASPKSRDYEEAARLAGEQELAALEQGGPNLQANLASVDRHRGVLAFLRGHYEVALDYFTRALERQRTAENLGNILCSLVRMGELEEAGELLDQVRRSFPTSLVRELEHIVQRDPDLALLRSEES